MQKFLLRTLLLLTILVLPWLIIFFLMDNNYHLDGGDIIFKYQKEKILNTKNDVKVAYFGDSSCGNAISAEILGPNYINLSLVADFNIKGVYEMIKMTKKYHPDLDSIIIINTLNVFPRKDKNFFQFDFKGQYSFNEKLKRSFSIFFRRLIVFNIDNIFKQKRHIRNDFLNQDNRILVAPMQFDLDRNISTDNMNSIKKIVDFCDKNGIEYLFMIGPNVKIQENLNYKSITEFFKNNDYNFSSSYYQLNDKNIGNTNDHVWYDYKEEATYFYNNERRDFYRR
jgi:hypothetical protein